MALEVVEKSYISQLARLIEQDIRKRELRAGDRYLTTKQVAEVFQTSPVTANRAMQSLAKRNVLVRRRRAGSFVGKNPLYNQKHTTRCIYLIAPHDYLRLEVHLEDLLKGMRDKLPDANFHLSFFPAKKPSGFLKQIVEQARDSNDFAGIVVASGTPEVRQFLRDCKLPVVVNGHTEPDIGLPWVDRDQAQIGGMIGDYLLKLGHQRIGLLMRDTWFPGDNLLTEAVTQKIAAAGLGAGSLTVMSLPANEQLIRRAVVDLLTRKDRPTGLICRTGALAHEAIEAAHAMGLSVPEDVVIVSCNYVPDSFSEHEIPHTSLEKRRQGQFVGQLLIQLAEGRKPSPDHYEIPVKLEGVS